MHIFSTIIWGYIAGKRDFFIMMLICLFLILLTTQIEMTAMIVLKLI